MTREQIVQHFEQMLDAALAEEAPPAGLAEPVTLPGGESEDRTCDSYALWQAVTTLVQEVRLQGRAFQELNHTLNAQTEKVAAELRAVWMERERQVQREAERRCRREILGSLIDLRDRLGRGLGTAETLRAERAAEYQRAMAKKSARFWGLFVPAPAGPVTAGPVTAGPVPDDALQAVVRGYELGVERLDQTLEEFNAFPIHCEGEAFDPRRMNAIDSEETSAYEEGTVMEVYRSGYEWSGEVFRPAQVKVARLRAGKENPNGETAI